jgi:hypothetical protein
MTPTWTTPDDVALAFGGTVQPDDAFLVACTDAANAFAWRRRDEAGYADDPVVSPGPDATMGVTMYAVALYRERGTVDSFASFNEFTIGAVPQSTFGQVLRLLGIPRGQCDAPPTADQLAARRLARRAPWGYAGEDPVGP